MTMDFADRLERVEPSATLAISNLAAELEADGVDVVDLSVGDVDAVGLQFSREVADRERRARLYAL